MKKFIAVPAKLHPMTAAHDIERKVAWCELSYKCCQYVRQLLLLVPTLQLNKLLVSVPTVLCARLQRLVSPCSHDAGSGTQDILPQVCFYQAHLNAAYAQLQHAPSLLAEAGCLGSMMLMQTTCSLSASLQRGC